MFGSSSSFIENEDTYILDCDFFYSTFLLSFNSSRKQKLQLCQRSSLLLNTKQSIFARVIFNFRKFHLTSLIKFYVTRPSPIVLSHKKNDDPNYDFYNVTEIGV